jgi:hypothetical protein
MEYITKQRIGFFFLLATIAIIFVILPYFDRKKEAKDIADHSKFALGKIVRLSHTLKSGDYWHYHFRYLGNDYEDSHPTHVDYDVNIGDYFLLNFSSANPEHNKILYQYKLNTAYSNRMDSIWDTIPKTILYSGLKSN